MGVETPRVFNAEAIITDISPDAERVANEGFVLQSRALAKKVIVVPGEFFDVNPGKRRSQRVSRFRSHVRFSFGPSLETLDTEGGAQLIASRGTGVLRGIRVSGSGDVSGRVRILRRSDEAQLTGG